MPLLMPEAAREERLVKWKPDWPEAREHFVQWWRGDGMVVWITAPRDRPMEDIAEPARPEDLTTAWIDPKFRCDQEEYQLARTYFGGDAFPLLRTMIGPGSLGMFLGAQPQFAPDTVWYEPCIDEPDAYGTIRFDPEDNRWWDVHLALLREAVGRANGRYRVGMPDLIENLDTLAAMRGIEELMTDLLARPGWVSEKLAEINQAYFAMFELLFAEFRDADGGCSDSAFSIWGPDKTAKVQCDVSAMISPAMFRRFVAPALDAQCRRLDHAMYHLDGEDALAHLDALLEIESIDAIEWTPRFLAVSAADGGGAAKWHELYRWIRSAGKSVQAVSVAPDHVLPLLDELGPAGMYLSVRAPNQAAAEKVEEDIRRYR